MIHTKRALVITTMIAVVPAMAASTMVAQPVYAPGGMYSMGRYTLPLDVA